MSSSCQAHWCFALSSTFLASTPTTALFRTSHECLLTSWLWSLRALPCKKLLNTTCSKSSRTFSFRRKSEITCCLRGFRTRNYACSGDTKTSGVDAENKLNPICGSKYPISLDHQILSDHSVCYSQALYNDLVFELTLAMASQVVKRADPTKLNWIQADQHSAPVQNDLQQDTSRLGVNRLP